MIYLSLLLLLAASAAQGNSAASSASAGCAGGACSAAAASVGPHPVPSRTHDDSHSRHHHLRGGAEASKQRLLQELLPPTYGGATPSPTPLPAPPTYPPTPSYPPAGPTLQISASFLGPAQFCMVGFKRGHHLVAIAVKPLRRERRPCAFLSPPLISVPLLPCCLLSPYR